MDKLQELQDLKATYVAVFSTPEGKRVLKHICKVGYVMRPTRVPRDPAATAENEGMRRLALSIANFAGRDITATLAGIE